MVLSQVVQKAPLAILCCTHNSSIIIAISAQPCHLLLSLLAPPLISECGFLPLLFVRCFTGVKCVSTPAALGPPLSSVCSYTCSILKRRPSRSEFTRVDQSFVSPFHFNPKVILLQPLVFVNSCACRVVQLCNLRFLYGGASPALELRLEFDPPVSNDSECRVFHLQGNQHLK
jgi:hypothetical protein